MSWGRSTLLALLLNYRISTVRMISISEGIHNIIQLFHGAKTVVSTVSSAVNWNTPSRTHDTRHYINKGPGVTCFPLTSRLLKYR